MTPVWVKVSLTSALLLASVWWLADRHDRHGNEARLSAIASGIAGRAVHVRCPGPIGRLFGWDTVEGSVRFSAEGIPADETRLRPGPCEELDALAEGGRTYALDCASRGGGCQEAERLARAVDVVTHESWHLQGVIDEGQTECRSLQTMARSAQQLGATAAQGTGAGAAAARDRLRAAPGPLPRRGLPRRRPARPAARRPYVSLALHHATVSASVCSSGISGSQPVASCSRSGEPRTSITSCARMRPGSTRCSTARPASGVSAATSSRADAVRPEQTL